MLVYLSKKIAIPNDTQLCTISWHRTKGFIACGGEDGLLKVLRLEVAKTKEARLKGLAAPSNLSMNQSLEGHNGSVQVVTWNEHHHKLTSSDQNGLIIVWILYKGLWHEEMINNRNKSVVRHMKWNREGTRICIVYEDGAVIVGAVDGNRIWGKELKGLVLTHVQWSPDSKIILFGNNKGEVHIFDSHGTYNSNLVIHCLSGVTGVVKLAGVEWYLGGSGHIRRTVPSLVVVFDNGRAQLMHHELDDNPILLDTQMNVASVQWNHNGSLLACGGSQKFQDGKELCCVQFYTAVGQIVYTLRVPGRNLCGVSWEGTGLRVALGVGPHIYFANIRHDYKWGFFADTLVYAFNKPDKPGECVVFLNVSNGERHAKGVKNLIAIASCADFCLLAYKVDQEPVQYTLLLCDALGTPLDSRYVEIEPEYVYMSRTHIVAASSSAFFVWQYRTSSRLATEFTHIFTKKGREAHDRLIHVDFEPSGGIATLDYSKAAIATSDPISAICVSDKILIVGRSSGVLQVYFFPKLTLESTMNINCKPQQLGINCNSTKLSIIDTNGVLHLYELQGLGQLGNYLPVDRKEVWNLCWANDDSELFAIMEKTRMYIFRGIDPEEPVISSGHLCHFQDMQVKSVLLDEIMKEPESPAVELVMDLDIKSLRDTRDLLNKVGLRDAQRFIEDNPHPRLWRLLAESALLELELDIAERAFVRCRDYQGIQAVKRIKKLDSEGKQKAEVQAHFLKFDEAEKIYLEMDRRDLAIDLRVKLGDWFRVVQLIKSGGGADDTLLIDAWNAIGDYYADRLKLDHAVTYYTQGRNYQKLAECYYRLDNFAALETLASNLTPNSPYLVDIAQKFMTVGMCEQAVEAYIKANMVKEAIDCCVELNQWGLAVELAKQHNFKEVDSLLVKYAMHLLENEKVLSAIELYRRAHHFLEAAKLLIKVAHEASVQSLGPHKIKKMCVLAALMIENHISHNRQKRGDQRLGSLTKKEEVMSTLKDIITEDFTSGVDGELVKNPWRLTEAYHFFLLVQKLFYAGKVDESLKMALYLRDYEDVLPPAHLYSLLALTGSASKAFGICSRAFTKLESLEGIPEEEKTSYDQLALQIFTKYPPKDTFDSRAIEWNCPTCNHHNKECTAKCASCDMTYPLSLVSGQPMYNYQSWKCGMCRHSAEQHEISIGLYKNCPLCHSPI